ncbi:MAG: [FeFe] hydrogenase H-cluster radical SAM maturase HydE [Ruminococcaceae bacterium]|nr:[FeFe] hydrogenase H-cluster radical SAM maturase HydE [Oscillospiraceae bacterium]
MELIKKLEELGALTKDEFIQLISTYTADDMNFARTRAVRIAKERFGNKIYIRGLIEFTNICRQDCFYCGLRCSNKAAERYRLTKDEILSCCEVGYPLGFRTFVLQGGEDPYFDDDKMCDIVRSIKEHYPDCAVTLSIGEKSKESYQKLFDAGADRFLLRHETANAEHYSKLHPKSQTLASRKQCLFDLKEIGFQTGCGFMVGSPYQTVETIAEDLLFIRELNPEMVGIGPFLPHKDTPFGNEVPGSVELSLFLLALVRIMLKKVLLPATTALGTADQNGREMGILSGANVVMPNLSPTDVRKKYMLYDNKIATGSEAAEGLADLRKRVQSIGYDIAVTRGDFQK